MSAIPNMAPPITVNCACCDERLAEGGDHCRQCDTPTALSRAVATRVGEQSFVSVLGASNAGKTVYLGLLLDILSKGPESFRGTATGAFSIDLQEQVVNALERRSFPDKTPSEADSWKWLHCQLAIGARKAARRVDLISPDFAGEAIAMEIDQGGAYPAIGHVVRKSSSIMVLIDSMRVRDAGSSEDLFAMKLASYIAELHGLASDSERRPGKATGPAIAIIFTKSDGCPEVIEDPSAFASNNTPRLFEYCRRTFARHSYFAASVAESSGLVSDSSGRQMRIPFHVRPQGIIEPIQWMIDRK